MGQEINISNIATISGLTMEQVLDKMVEKKIGISSGATSSVPGAFGSDTINGRLIAGETVQFDGMYWIVVHTDYVNRVAYLASTIIVTETPFGTNTAYKGSTLAAVAANFEKGISAKALSVMKNVTVNGVTAKVFAPSREQVVSTFSYFKQTTNRICQYNGVNFQWWTSSLDDSYRPYCINMNGDIPGIHAGTVCGFRPFIALAL